MQIQAGAELVMLFDSWAGNLSNADYHSHVLPSLESLLAELKACDVPVVYFPGQGSSNLSKLEKLPVDVLAVDWRVGLSEAAEIVSANKYINALQGNLDPLVLSWGDENLVRSKVQEVLAQAKSTSDFLHIFNVGHGVLPTTSPQAVSWAIEEVKKMQVVPLS